MAELTAEERTVLKTAAFGAVFLVSNADPGFFTMLKESFAASGALAGTTGLVKNVLTTGALPRLPRPSRRSSDGTAEVEAIVLPALARSVAILDEKAPDEVANYRTAVIAATEQAAHAAHGVNAREAEMITKVRAALGLAPTDE